MSRSDPLEDYSAGYYSVDFRVVPFEDGPTIDRRFYEYLDQHVYANTDAPVWMRASFQPSPYFRVQGEEPMPTDILGLPEEWMVDLDIEDDNQRRRFFLCKPAHAHFVSQSVLFGNAFEDTSG